MKVRLQVLIQETLDAKLRQAAQRRGQSKGEWVRRALEHALTEDRERDPLDRLARLEAPTADIDRMLAEIGARHR